MYIVDQLWFQIISGKDMPEALEVEKGIEEMDRLFYDLSQRYKEFLKTKEKSCLNVKTSHSNSS